MTPLAQALAGPGGPGPWILLVPLVWALVVAGAVLVLRRTAWRGRPPWHGPRDGAGHGPSPATVLGRRFAAGQIDEDEYRRRLAVLDERSGTGSHEGGDS
ncbi:SHOCT domain-containing protein [Streptomyces pactum]|uniref:SHOCT domain-containing protein n=1 Tax=Streptomyces pactum TaxID=68249 RepID=A0ABS0NFB4_9ACTN|nr:SHOCT domain-containing protein [Streptomyces pactum]MBH5333867.1 SHOCT domain-containing protein [Streptomyces pactum]